MAVRIEDAGFDIRDQIMWIYGSGFPKSHNIGKSIDKMQNNQRQVIGEEIGTYKLDNAIKNAGVLGKMNQKLTDDGYEIKTITKGNSIGEGWGTALKPAHEPIVMARKPIEGTVAENVLEWGTGGINIDGCRIGYSEDDSYNSIVGGVEEGKDSGIFKTYDGRKTPGHKKKIMVKNNEGRFPANIILECTCENPKVVSDKYDIRTYNDYKNTFKSYEENDKDKGEYEIKDVETTKVIHTDPSCPCYILDKQSGNRKGMASQNCNNQALYGGNALNQSTTTRDGFKVGFNDEGGASRFFYCPKTSAREREEGLVGLQTKANAHMATQNGTSGEASKGMERFKTQPKQNFHPTVKPTELMKYLIRLVTPKDGIVLDPFMGSGSTGKAAMQEGMWFVGIEREKEYFEIAKQRIEYEADKRKFW
jgi:site-specific DNA-methyltransferase (adenine-specific)